MALYEILFQIAVLLFIPSFIFWLLSDFFHGKGLGTISAAFTYPTIIIVITAAILAMLVEELSLNIKLMLTAVAIVWLTTYKILDSPSETRWHKFAIYVFQLISLFGAWLIVDLFYLI